MRGFPLQLDVRGHEALIVGTGVEVVSKIDRLVAAGARVTVVSQAVDAALEERARGGRVAVERRAFADADWDGKLLVFLAPGDEELAARLFERARREGRLLCTID